MNQNVSPSVNQIACSYVDDERFSSPSEVLLFSLDLLGAFEKHYQSRLERDLAIGFNQLDQGESTYFATPKQVNEFFDDVVQADRMRTA